MRTLLVLHISTEFLRYLSVWWMRRAREVDKYLGCIPFLDMRLPSVSLLLVALQYMAILICTFTGEVG